MKKTANEVAAANEQHQMNNIFNKAISSSSNREKNTLIGELRQLSSSYLVRMENLNLLNQQKQLELEILKKNLQNKEKDLADTQLKKAFLQLLIAKAKSPDFKQKPIIDAIRQLEEEIGSLDVLSEPETLDSLLISNNSLPEEKSIQLLDLKLRRAEESAYAHQKRIISVERNEECSDEIVSEFGSIFGLIDAYQSLCLENQRLKSEETEFLNDFVIRRHHLESLNNNFARVVITYLRSEFADLRRTLSVLQYNTSFKKAQSSTHLISFNQPKHSEGSNSARREKFRRPKSAIDKVIESIPDFDSLCRDKNFVPFEKADQEHFEKIQKQMEETIAQITKMREELIPLRKYKLISNEMTKNRLSVLTELNIRLFSQIAVLSDNIDQSYKEFDEMADQLMNVFYEKAEYRAKYSSIFEPYRYLLVSDKELKIHQYRNHAILSSLFSINSEIGEELMNLKTSDLPNHFLSQVQLKAMMKFEERKKNPIAGLITPKKSNKDLYGDFLNPKISKSDSKKGVIVQSTVNFSQFPDFGKESKFPSIDSISETASNNPETLHKPSNQFKKMMRFSVANAGTRIEGFNSPKVEVIDEPPVIHLSDKKRIQSERFIDFVHLCIAGSCYGTEYGKKMLNILYKNFKQMGDDIRSYLNTMNEEMERVIVPIEKAYSFMLRRDKTETETQTEVTPMEDAEVQLDSKPPKTPTHTPAKPKPKK